MKTILHIGQHKTGTTSIQHSLKSRRGELAGAGLYVPDSLIGHNNPSHYILNVYALDPGRGSPMKEKLLKENGPEFLADLRPKLETDIARHYRLAEKQQCKKVIWSNEGLYLLHSEREYKRLRALFDAHSDAVVCVCCFRDRASYRASYMMQLQRNGIAFSEDRSSYRYVDEDSWLFDYDRKEKILRQVFDEVIVFPYREADMVKTFMEQIGYTAGPVDELRLNVTREKTPRVLE